ncbi:hypothetical protein [Ketobacter sp.]|uniref:hypothetical protein n=1 Tax=Ketobacter sp. TaxID=2083498 RepID=UPI000F1168B6|nr:hypothetical protein [Ketobacter sp.]RLU01754.1 MAG: hypothetical protein D9N14_01050 [Ketobacter sp.]
MTVDREEFLEEWATTGEFRDFDVFEFTVSHARPLLFSEINLSWQGEGALYPVNLYKDGEPLLMDQPSTGSYRLAVDSPESFQLQAEFGDIIKECLVTPRVEQPVIQGFNVKPEVFVNEDIAVKYKVKHAERVEICCRGMDSDYENTIIQDGTAKNTLYFKVPGPGAYSINLVVLGEHAIISEQAITTATISFVAKYHMPVIQQFVADKSKAVLGKPISIRWQTAHATQIWFEDSNGERIPVPAAGTLSVNSAATIGPSRHRLVAENIIGEQTVATVAVKWIQPPPRLNLAVSATTIGKGEVIQLSWRAENVREYWLECHNQRHQLKLMVKENSGSLEHRPLFDCDYYLIAVNFAGEVIRRKLTVTVQELPRGIEFDRELESLSKDITDRYSRLSEKQTFT